MVQPNAATCDVGPMSSRRWLGFALEGANARSLPDQPDTKKPGSEGPAGFISHV